MVLLSNAEGSGKGNAAGLHGVFGSETLGAGLLLITGMRPAATTTPQS